MTLVSASMVDTTVSAARLPPIATGDDGDVHSKRQTTSPLALPVLSEVDQNELMRLYGVYKSVKKIQDFNELASKAPTGKALETLAKKLGGGSSASNVRGALNRFPGQPQTVIYSFLSGIGGCLFQGKALTEAIECGKNEVRKIKDNDVVEVPETCNNRLGQLELFGTGWPAPCNDPNSITHPQGSAAHRAFKWAFCKVSSAFYPKELREMEARNIGTCEDRFPSDQQIKDNLCKKYFGGSPCGATFPLNNEEDFKNANIRQELARNFFFLIPPQVKFEGMLELQEKGPEFVNISNSMPLAGETCLGGKCGEVCQGGKCMPMREVCEPKCIPDEVDIGKCNCGWDQIRQKCDSCHIDKCGECVLKPITAKDGNFFAKKGDGDDLEQLHTECRDNSECYFVPDRPIPALPINP
ncbi:hypothetical protein VFPPC_13796 [Pochonia chlamydosporia 170]|uniref:Uncharacterized protein n=1 Tax=Pochonia chlamydosporia 170 TaxID=1380566 RepID=A0A179FVW8_METCM|nr:hypothetical protein VFPPC_13796 [Pochonia chlamydosporia 170]OAQ69139.1 hypothetical protein VFPPC_13796 [Pochonia chlamydosporia 170]